MRITDEQRQKLHEMKYGIKILCHEGGTVLIVGDECYSFVTDLSLAANSEGRTLTISLDADAFIAEFMAPAEAKGNQHVNQGEKSGLTHKKILLKTKKNQ